MTSHITEQFFEARELASVAAATHIVGALRKRLDAHDDASLLVTGGSSPLRCYSELAESDLNWSAVQIALTDERWVPPTDSNSNEKLVRENLITGRANAAQLLPIYAADITPAEQCQYLNEFLPTIALPFACTLLGMGGDGHVASLFPDAENLESGLDSDNPEWCIPVTTDASEHARVSMTFSALVRSDSIALLFFGDDKRDIYEQAKAATLDVPVAQLLSQSRVPVHAFWAT
jgi:6-phosphogluconolactonase